jgi:hypothetical protein
MSEVEGNRWFRSAAPPANFWRPSGTGMTDLGTTVLVFLRILL